MALTTLQDSLFALSKVGVRPAAAGTLADSLEETAMTLQAAIVDDIPAFTASGNPDVMPDLRTHVGDLLQEIHRLVGGARSPQLEFVRRHAAQRAEQRFPLEALLHAYRTCHKVAGQWLRSAVAVSVDESRDINAALAAVADFTIDCIDSISTIATSEYVRRTRRLSETEADRRSQLLSLLLEGYDESDGRVTKLLRSAGYLDQRQSYCVILARSVVAQEMQNTARANRLLAATRKALEDLPVRALFGFHDYRVVVIASATRRLSGWTAPQAALASRVGWPLLSLGNAVLVGVSADVPSTALIPKALREAELALEVADVGRRVVQYSDIPLRTLLLRLADDSIRSAMPAWALALREADHRSRGALIATLKAYADADMNVLKSAKHLNVHPNTIYARMQKIRDITALDPLGYHGLNEMLLAVDCMQIDAA